VPDEFLHDGRGDGSAFHETGEGMAEGVERQLGDLSGAGPNCFGFGVRSPGGEPGVGHDLLELIGESTDAQTALDACVSGREHVLVLRCPPRLGLLEPLQERRRDWEDLPTACLLGGEAEGGRFEIDRFPLERGDVAKPLTGVEAGEDEAAPFTLGDCRSFRSSSTVKARRSRWPSGWRSVLTLAAGFSSIRPSRHACWKATLMILSFLLAELGDTRALSLSRKWATSVVVMKARSLFARSPSEAMNLLAADSYSWSVVAATVPFRRVAQRVR